MGYTTLPADPAWNNADPTGWSQSFSNFTWNTPSMTNLANLGRVDAADRLDTIGGNFSVISTGSGSLKLGSGSAVNLSVGGNFSQSAGSFILGGSSGATMSVDGNFSVTSGTFNLNEGSGTNTVDVGGNFTHTGGTITETSGAGSFIFNGAGIQTYTSGGTVANTINFTVNGGSTLYMGTSLLGNGSIGTFTLSSNGTLGIGDAAGITTSGATGNIRVTGTRTYNTGASYVYNGSAAQATGNGLPATVNNLTVNNTGGNVTLTNAATTVNGALTLTSGDLSTGSGANVLTLAAAATCNGTTDVVSLAGATGGVSRTTLGTGTARCFGNPNVVITIDSGATPPTALLVRLVKSTPTSPAKANSIIRTYSIVPTGGTTFSATVRLHYLDSELNGNTATLLRLWKVVSGTWTEQDPTGASTTRNTTASDSIATNNWVQLTGITSFSRLDARQCRGRRRSDDLGRFGDSEPGQHPADGDRERDRRRQRRQRRQRGRVLPRRPRPGRHRHGDGSV